MLSAGLRRAVGNASESHTYTFPLSPGSVMVAPDLSTLTLDTGTQLGPFGAMNLTLGKTGALGTASAPPGCTTGTFQMRTGSLTGSVRFAADPAYFKTIVQTTLPADVAANTSGTPATCGAPQPSCAHFMEIFTGNPATPSGGFFGLLQDGQVQLVDFFTQAMAPATITHCSSSKGLPARDLTIAPDFSSATVNTAGAAPWFTGSLAFAAGGPAQTGTNPACGTPVTFAQARSAAR